MAKAATKKSTAKTADTAGNRKAEDLRAKTDDQLTTQLGDLKR